MCNIFYETYNKSMKNWLFFPQEYVQMIFILLTQWKIHRALCPLSYLLPLVCIITVFPRKRNGLLCLGSQIISCCRQRSWCRSKLGSQAFPFKCLISLFYLLSINFMWTGSGGPKWVMGSTGVGGTSVWWLAGSRSLEEPRSMWAASQAKTLMALS